MKVSSALFCMIPFYGSNARFRLCLYMREFFRKKHMVFMATCLKSYIQHKWGCEISISAQVSPKAVFMHTVGIVIGEGSIVEENVTLFSGVCIGRKDIMNDDDYPIVKKGSVLGTGSKILGKIIISEDTTIGANSVVLQSCEPSGGVYVGLPAQRVK